MFKRILYVVSEKQEEKHVVVDLAKAGDSAVLLSGLLGLCHLDEVNTEGATRRRVLLEEEERKCWRDLYRLEEEFKSAGIKASVMAHEGDIEDIQALARNTNSDLIVISAASLAGSNYRLPDEFIAGLPCPIIIANTG
ncbi:universal stress protein [candidate division WOR-3 bacterium]|nr:universal stress protein [candidate division WOR-3 bacterium]